MKHVFFVVALIVSIALSPASSANAQWVQAKGLYGGVMVTSFAVNGLEVFAGTDGGVYRSADNRTEWTLTTLTDFVTALAVIGNNIFAAVPDSGVFLSTDNGTMWNAVNNGLPSGTVTAIIANGTELLAGMAGNGLYRSTDTGKSWVKDATLTSTCTVNAISANGRYIVASMSCSPEANTNGLKRSTDDGRTWIEPDNSLSNVWFFTFTSVGSTIFAGTDSGFYLSIDHGANWTSANSGLPDKPVKRNVLSILADSNHIFVGMGSFFLDYALRSAPWDTIFGFPTPMTIDSIYSTTNSGASWAPLSSGINSIQVNAFAVLGDNIYAGTPTGIYLSTDLGKTWTEANNGLTSTDVGSFAANGKNLFAGTTDGVYISTDSGAEWSSTHSNLSPLFADFIIYAPQLETGDSTVYAWYLDALNFSTNNGETWIPANLPTNDSDDEGVSGFAVSGSNLYAGSYGYSGIYISTNNGENWALKRGSFPPYQGTSSLAISGDTIFAITFDSIYVSVDSFTSWKSESIGSPVDTINFSKAVNAFIANGKNLYAVIKDSLFHSTDNGTSWTAVGFPFSSNFAIAVSGTNIIVGAGDTVCISSDNGASWKMANDGLLEPFSINTFTIAGNYLIAGTSSQGIWRRPISELFPSSAVAEQQAAPSELQNYPNPFSKSTTITFSSPESGVAEITIVNLLGSEVARIFSGEMDAGQHKFSWDASGMPPGMYECIVRMNGGVLQVPMVLEKIRIEATLNREAVLYSQPRMERSGILGQKVVLNNIALQGRCSYSALSGL